MKLLWSGSVNFFQDGIDEKNKLVLPALLALPVLLLLPAPLAPPALVEP